MDLDLPEELLEQPLLRVLSEVEWSQLALPEAAREFARAVSGSDSPTKRRRHPRPTRTARRRRESESDLDSMYHAHAHEWSEFHQRIGVFQGLAAVAAPEEVSPAMLATANSESFVTFDDAVKA